MTYGHIYRKFVELNPNLDVKDYRPYELKDNSIIVWVCQDDPYETVELAFHYRTYTDEFVLIPNAMKFKDILQRKEA